MVALYCEIGEIRGVNLRFDFRRIPKVEDHETPPLGQSFPQVPRLPSHKKCQVLLKTFWKNVSPKVLGVGCRQRYRIEVTGRVVTVSTLISEDEIQHFS